MDERKRLCRVLSAASEPVAYRLVYVCVCMSVTLRSNISEIKGARGQLLLGAYSKVARIIEWWRPRWRHVVTWPYDVI